jgi:hypothetical protein
MLKRYLLYLLRWQLSTPILAVCVNIFAQFGNITSTIIANLVGGLIFFWIDRVIFKSKYAAAIWSVSQAATCVDCGLECRGYRLVQSGKYDRSNAPAEYRCEACSVKKAERLAEMGVEV